GGGGCPMALVVARRDPDPSAFLRRSLSSAPASSPAPIPQRALQASGPWALSSDAGLVAQRLSRECSMIEERWRPSLGVKTGADSVFLVPDETPGARRAVRGRDLSRWTASPRVYLLWPHDLSGRPLQQLDGELAARLGPHLERLKRRADYRGGPAWQLF